jgi:flavodoxin
MKIAIVYYSYTGNTERVAKILTEILREKGKVDLFKIVSLNESKSFFAQVYRALFKKRAKIEDINFDLSGYELIFFGTPVWACLPTPAMNTYLDRCFGLEGKSIILFVTYHSGVGVKRCLNYMQDILTKKGVKNFKRFSLQESKVEDKKFIEELLLTLNL